MRAALTVLSSDMVFGVGLGCLVQMLKTHSNVQVIVQNMSTGVAEGSFAVVSAAVSRNHLDVMFCLLLFLRSLKWTVC